MSVRGDLGSDVNQRGPGIWCQSEGTWDLRSLGGDLGSEVTRRGSKLYVVYRNRCMYVVSLILLIPIINVHGCHSLNKIFWNHTYIHKKQGKYTKDGEVIHFIM